MITSTTLNQLRALISEKLAAEEPSISFEIVGSWIAQELFVVDENSDQDSVSLSGNVVNDGIIDYTA